MIPLLFFNRWTLLLALLVGGYALTHGAPEAFERAFPGFGEQLAVSLGSLVASAAALVFMPWDTLADQLPPKYQPIWRPFLTGFWGHVLAVMLVAAVVYLMVRLRVETKRADPPGAKKRGRVGPPGRLPFVDHPQRMLPIGKDARGRAVVANIATSNMLIAGGTGSGKTAIMRHLADSDEAVFFGLFDISLPSIARFRYWQEQARQGKLLDAQGRVRPVVIWRPNPDNLPGFPKLRLCDGPPLEVISRIQHAFKESASSTGDQKAKALHVGVAIFEDAVRRGEVPCLDLLIGGWREAASNPKLDREVRTSCWRWASKVSAMKAMVGDAEGPDGINPLDIMARRGKLALEVNNFAIAEAASAFGPLILGLAIWLVNASPVPINVGFDEGNQLGDRVEDLDKIYTACRSRKGRCCLCCQKPLKFKEIAPNADVVVVAGFGPGAYAEQEWASRVTSGAIDPDGFKKRERNWYGRISRRFGKLEGLMNLECYVVHEGSTEGPVFIADPWPEMQRCLRPVDWPEHRAQLTVPLGWDEDPLDEPPDPLDPQRTGRAPVSERGMAATRKAPPRAPDPLPLPTRAQTGTLSGGAEQSVGAERGQRNGMPIPVRSGPPPTWVQQSTDGMRWWQSISGTAEPGPSGALWLWTGGSNQSNGRPKSTRVVSEVELERLRAKNPDARPSQSCLVYPELYQLAGCPHGEPWEGCSYDHLSHSRDETCPGGRECIHLLDVNPWNIQPVTPQEQARRRDAQRAMHNEWRMKQGLPPLEDPLDRARDARPAIRALR